MPNFLYPFPPALLHIHQLGQYVDVLSNSVDAFSEYVMMKCAIIVRVQVALFAWKGLDRALNAWQLLAVGAAASVLRWMVMATCPSPPLLIAAQLLHGLTFGACHLGCIRFVQTAVPPRISATATAFIGAMSEGVFMAGATFVSGQVLASHGFGTFWLMSAMGAAGLAMSTLLGRIWDGRRLKLK